MISTCQEQAVVGSVHLDLCIEFAGSILEPVALINDDVLPSQLGQARPISLPHHEVVAGQQHIKPGLSPSNLHSNQQSALVAKHCMQGWRWGQDPPKLQHGKAVQG